MMQILNNINPRKGLNHGFHFNLHFNVPMLTQVYKFLREYVLEPVGNIFFPPVCFFCNSYLEHSRKIICYDCWKQLPRLSNNEINQYIQKTHSSYIDDLTIIFQFSPNFKELIHLLKYDQHFTLASYFAEEFSKILKAKSLNNFHGIIPVPLHPVRMRERGYNQSALIGERLHSLTGIPMNDHILRRKRNTKSQTKLNRSQRIQNVKNAFVCLNRLETGKYIILDDVITTGSTINECAKVLKENGAEYIYAIALATPLEKDDYIDTQNNDFLAVL